MAALSATFITCTMICTLSGALRHLQSAIKPSSQVLRCGHATPSIGSIAEHAALLQAGGHETHVCTGT